MRRRDDCMPSVDAFTSATSDVSWTCADSSFPSWICCFLKWVLFERTGRIPVGFAQGHSMSLVVSVVLPDQPIRAMASCWRSMLPTMPCDARGAWPLELPARRPSRQRSLPDGTWAGGRGWLPVAAWCLLKGHSFQWLEGRRPPRGRTPLVGGTADPAVPLKMCFITVRACASSCCSYLVCTALPRAFMILFAPPFEEKFPPPLLFPPPLFLFP